MTEFQLVLIVCVGIPILGGIVSFVASDLTDSRHTKRNIGQWHVSQINKPDFRKEKELVFETEEIPEFELETETHPSITDKQQHKDLYETSFDNSTPPKDMEEGIEELLAATSVIEQQESHDDYLPPQDEDAPPLEEITELPKGMAEISPLGENWYFVAKRFGTDVANLVTASPDFALEQGVDYILFGNIEGEFLNSFGEKIKLKGLPEDIDFSEHILLKGTFITADLFQCVEMISAESASLGEDFQVLNIGFA